MPAPRVMFVNHTSKIAGAELVLLDLVRPWQGASAFLFEDGPLNTAMGRQGLRVITSRWGKGLSTIRRDRSLWKAAPLACRLGAIVTEIGTAARRHDVIYANSQKAFVLAAFAAFFARRPLVWHLHDIIDGAHFGSMQRRLQVALANRVAARVIVPSNAAAAAFVDAGGRRDLIEVVPNGVSIVPETSEREQIRKALALPDAPLVGVFSRLVALEGAARRAAGARHASGRARDHRGRRAVRRERLCRTLAGARRRARHRGSGAFPRPPQRRVRADAGGRRHGASVRAPGAVRPHPGGSDAGRRSRGRNRRRRGFRHSRRAATAGTLVRPDDADDLAAAIERVLADPAALQSQLDRAAARARTHYGVPQMLDTVSDVIQRVATRSGV